VKYGILAYVTLAHALHKQGRMAELEVYISQKKPEAIVQKLLKKAEREDLLKQMCDMLKAELDYTSDFKVERLSEKIDKVIVTGII